MRRTFSAALLLGIALTVVPAGAEMVSGIAAIVNDELVTYLELNREYDIALKEARKKGAVTDEAAARLRGDVLNALVDRKLVRQKVKELNIVIGEEELRQSIEEVKRQNKLSQEALVAALLSQGLTFDQYKAQMKEQLERLRLMSQEVKSKILVTEREIREQYEANPGLYSDEVGYRARHIFFRIPKNANNAEIRKVMVRAIEVMNEARSGKDFLELVRKNSDDPNAAKDGGDLGLFRKGEMLPEIESAAVEMNPGDVSELVSTPAGFHVLKLEEKIPAKVKPLEAVRAGIEEALYRKKSEERFNQWTQELRRSASVEIKAERGEK
jgi:peptidyl-prolyl cis-trans isomerase SurA